MSPHFPRMDAVHCMSGSISRLGRPRTPPGALLGCLLLIGILAGVPALRAAEGGGAPALPPTPSGRPVPPRPDWGTRFWEGPRERSPAELLRQRRYPEVLTETLAALAGAESLAHLFEPWEALRKALPALPLEEVERTLRSERARLAGGSPALDLLTARLRLHPAWGSFFDRTRAHETLERLSGGSGPLALLAGYCLGLDLAESDPAGAIPHLRALTHAKGDPGSFGPLASLSLGRAYLRSDQARVALGHYRQALRKYRRFRLDPEGAVAPYFHHGLAESLEALGQPVAAVSELESLLLRFPDYPARSQAKSLLASLRKER